jgi:hypothetical protein
MKCQGCGQDPPWQPESIGHIQERKRLSDLLVLTTPPWHMSRPLVGQIASLGQAAALALPDMDAEGGSIAGVPRCPADTNARATDEERTSHAHPLD